jgi:hypothetical protein
MFLLLSSMLCLLEVRWQKRLQLLQVVPYWHTFAMNIVHRRAHHSPHSMPIKRLPPILNVVDDAAGTPATPNIAKHIATASYFIISSFQPLTSYTSSPLHLLSILV